MLEAVEALRAEMLEMLGWLVRQPSVSGSDAENAAQHEMARLFQADGLETDVWPILLEDVERDPDFPGMEVARREAWGVVGRLPGRGGGRTLLLNGHIDVVPPGDLAAWTTGGPYSGRVENGRLYGRGSCDMKAGLAACVWAVRALRSAGVSLRGDLLVASVQGEEDGGMGSFALIRRGWRADACVIPEPTGMHIVAANAGALTFRLRVVGRATHASRRMEGVSAIEKLWPVWQALRSLERRRNAHPDPLMRGLRVPYALSVGIVRAGDWASSVPDLLVAEGRLGVKLDESPADARGDLEQAVAEACRRDPWLRDHPVEVEWWGGQFASGRLPADSDLLERTRRAHLAAGGRARPRVCGAPWGSDLRLMVGLAGIPTLHYGPGDATVAHGPDEYVPLAEYALTARTLALLALDICA